jgi:hypothetical protein
VIGDQLLRIGAEAIAYGGERTLRVGSADAGKQGIALALRLRVDADSATGRDRFGKGAAGFESPLILVGPNVNVRGVLASIPADQVFAGEPLALIGAHEPDEFPPVRREIAGRDAPFGPWLGRDWFRRAVSQVGARTPWRVTITIYASRETAVIAQSTQANRRSLFMLEVVREPGGDAIRASEASGPRHLSC